MEKMLNKIGAYRNVNVVRYELTKCKQVEIIKMGLATIKFTVKYRHIVDEDIDKLIKLYENRIAELS